MKAPRFHLIDKSLENAFLNGLDPVVRDEVMCWQPLGIHMIMSMRQLVEIMNRLEAGKHIALPNTRAQLANPKPTTHPLKRVVRPPMTLELAHHKHSLTNNPPQTFLNK